MKIHLHMQALPVRRRGWRGLVRRLKHALDGAVILELGRPAAKLTH